MTRAGTPTVAELMALLAANAAENAALRAERDALEQRVFKLEEEPALAQLHRFAPRSEKHMDRVFNEAENAALETDADERLADGDETDATELPDTGLPEVEKPEGRKRGRKPLPANLPRQRVEYDLADDQKTCPCCRHPLHRMGELVTEQLHIEVKATVLQNARAKYACRNCERTDISTPVVIAPMPAQPLPGSIARPRRWPLLLFINMSTALETTVQVLKEKDRKATDESCIWGYRSGKDSVEPVVLLEYQPGRGQVHPQSFLGDYGGILMSDGYQGWRTLKDATHVGCMAHARRRFVNAFKAGKKQSGTPAEALKFFEQLYRIERQVRDEKPDDRETQADCIRRLRQKHSVPVLDALKEWLDRMVPKVVPDTKLGDAISYTRNQWQYLTRYTEDGRMPTDDNLLERDIGVFATGRKSWLFCDTVDGAKASAVTCRACGVEPFAWLRHVFTELPQRPDGDNIDDLLPFNFAKSTAA